MSPHVAHSNFKVILGYASGPENLLMSVRILLHVVRTGHRVIFWDLNVSHGPLVIFISQYPRLKLINAKAVR